MSTESITEILKSIEPQIDILSDKSIKNRPAKRRALDTLALSLTPSLLPHLLPSLLSWTESDIESIRERSLQILTQHPTPNLTILKHAIKRITFEETEEIRMGWLDLCLESLNLIPTQSIDLKLAESYLDLFEVAGRDPFPEIQKKLGQLMLVYSKRQPKSVDYACDRCVRLLFPLLTHKHTAVRVSAIKAMESILLASPKGLYLLFEFDSVSNRQPILPCLIYDTSALVRDSLFRTLGNLLCLWTPRERYQYGGKVLPIILSGQFDDLPSVQETCQSSLIKVSESCVEDLKNAEVIDSIPKDKNQIREIGLKHLVHMCFDDCLLYLLTEITGFIKLRLEINLKALSVFLNLSNPDDLVKSTKRMIHYSFIAFSNQLSIDETQTIRQAILDNLNLLTQKLPSPDIYAETLLPRLDIKYLNNEKSGYSGHVTITVVMTFLEQLVGSTTTLSTTSKKNIQSTIQKPYLYEFIENQSLDLYKQSINSNL